MVDIQSQGVSACQKDIDAQVKFESIDEQGVFDVTLDYVFVAIQNVLDVTGQEDTPSLW